LYIRVGFDDAFGPSGATGLKCGVEGVVSHNLHVLGVPPLRSTPSANLFFQAFV
jgi:hypothetical protein